MMLSMTTYAAVALIAEDVLVRHTENSNLAEALPLLILVGIIVAVTWGTGERTETHE